MPAGCTSIALQGPEITLCNLAGTPPVFLHFFHLWRQETPTVADHFLRHHQLLILEFVLI
jgi:hypothetical protein